MALSARKHCSHGTSPCPVDTKSHPRHRSAQARCEPSWPLRPFADLELHGLTFHMVDPVGELEDEPDGVEVLPHEVRGVPVQAEGLPVADEVERPPGRPTSHAARRVPESLWDHDPVTSGLAAGLGLFCARLREEDRVQFADDELVPRV
jgi:hypothetical protein